MQSTMPRPCLGFILMNPPTTSGAQTMRHIEAATRALGGAHSVSANLFCLPTRNTVEIQAIAHDAASWREARPALADLIETADELVAAWGLPRLTGVPRRHLDDQLAFMSELAHSRGKAQVWTVNGHPRHPSRWHQYVSDRHGRALGTTLEMRLASVMVRRPLSGVITQGRTKSLETSP